MSLSITSSESLLNTYGNHPIPESERLINEIGIPSDTNFFTYRDWLRSHLSRGIITRVQDTPLTLPDFFKDIPFATALRYFPRVDTATGELLFHPTTKTNIADKPIPIKVGRFLNTKLKGHFDETTVAALVGEHKAKYAPPEFKLLTDPEEIYALYTAPGAGWNSCMRYPDGSSTFKLINPVRVYASPDLAVAVALRGNVPLARTIVNLKDRTYIRLFGDPNIMMPLLEANDFARPGTLVGCRIKKIIMPHPDNSRESVAILPYFDGPPAHVIKLPNDPEHFLCVTPDTPDSFHGSSQRGWVPYIEQPYTCTRCGAHYCRTNRPPTFEQDRVVVCPLCLPADSVFTTHLCLDRNNNPIHVPDSLIIHEVVRVHTTELPPTRVRHAIVPYFLPHHRNSNTYTYIVSGHVFAFDGDDVDRGYDEPSSLHNLLHRTDILPAIEANEYPPLTSTTPLHTEALPHGINPLLIYTYIEQLRNEGTPHQP